jgi:hypothetical protein
MGAGSAQGGKKIDCTGACLVPCSGSVGGTEAILEAP